MIIKRQHDEGACIQGFCGRDSRRAYFLYRRDEEPAGANWAVCFWLTVRGRSSSPMTFSLSSRSRITFSARGSRNRTLRLFASFRDPETQDRLALALPAFRD